MERPSLKWFVPVLFLFVGIAMLMSADYYGEIGALTLERSYFWKGTASLLAGGFSIKVLGL